MKTFAIAALLVSGSLALSGHGHGHHHAARGLKSGPHHLKHVARGSAANSEAVFNDRLHLARRDSPSPAGAKRAAAPFDIRDAQRFTKRNVPSTLQRRKVLGEGDSATYPSNAAKGTFTAKQGCTVWHTVLDGEVCLGLIDKSSAGFTLDTFYKFNPSLSAGCTGLAVGTAYCVDNGKVTPAAATKSANKAFAVATKTGSASTSTSTDGLDSPVDNNNASDDGDDEDCDEDGSDDGDDEDCDDEEDGSDDGDGEDEDCDDEDDGDDSSSSSDSNSSSNSNSNSNSGNSNSNSNGNKQASPVLQVSASIGLGNGSGNGNQPASTSTAQQSQPSGGSNNGGSSSGGNPSQYSGIATYYYQNGNAGNCGEYNPDSALIVALYSNVYGNGNYCGKQVKLTNTDTGASVVATVADSCPSCSTDGNIDLSVAAFKIISGNNLDAGVENVKWGFI